MELTYSGEDKMGPETVGSVVGEQGTNSLSLRTMGGAGCVLRVSKVSGTKIYRQLRKGIEVLQNKLGAGKGEKLGWGRGQLSMGAQRALRLGGRDQGEPMVPDPVA